MGNEKRGARSFSGKGVFPVKYAFTLLIPLRSIFLSPKTLLRRLELADDHYVLEIGPGPGYFSPHVAKRLKNGHLVLLDIQAEMVDMARRRLDKRGIRNVAYSVTDGWSFDLESELFDRIFMVTVMGEVENQEVYLKEIYRTLKKGGILSITELAGDPDKITIEALQSLVCRHGFAVSRIFGNRRNYTMNFVKDDPA